MPQDPVPSLQELALFLEDSPTQLGWLEAALRGNSLYRQRLALLEEIRHEMGGMEPSRALDELAAAGPLVLELLRSPRVEIPEHPVAVVALLIRRVRQELRSTPAAAVRISFIALHVADHLVQLSQAPVRVASGKEPGDGVLLVGTDDRDEVGALLLRSRALACLAHSLRAVGTLEQAERCLARAQRDLGECGLADKRRAAGELLVLEASLRQRQCRFEEAERLLTRAVEIYQELEDEHSVGLVLMQRADILGQVGTSLDDDGFLLRALPLLDAQRDENAVEECLQGLVRRWLARGREAEAEELMEGMASPESTLARARRTWTGALLLAARDQPEEALGVLQSALTVLQRADARVLALELAIDLVGVAAQGNGSEFATLVHEVLKTFDTVQGPEPILRSLCTLWLAALEGSVPGRKLTELRRALRSSC